MAKSDTKKLTADSNVIASTATILAEYLAKAKQFSYENDLPTSPDEKRCLTCALRMWADSVLDTDGTHQDRKISATFCNNLTPFQDRGISDTQTHPCKQLKSSQKLYPVIECKHWLEVQDKHHRYGSYLKPYYDEWQSLGYSESFFDWLDNGEGRFVDLSHRFRTRVKKCVPRALLDQAKVQYCSEKEREQYKVTIKNGLMVWAHGRMDAKIAKHQPVDTGSEDERWIFVIDVSGYCYVNRKVKGHFHHSSFVAGSPVRAAGRLVVRKGVVITIGPNSGHYLTTREQLHAALNDLSSQHLKSTP